MLILYTYIIGSREHSLLPTTIYYTTVLYAYIIYSHYIYRVLLH